MFVPIHAASTNLQRINLASVGSFPPHKCANLNSGAQSGIRSQLINNYMSKYPYTVSCLFCNNIVEIRRPDNIKKYCNKSCAGSYNNQHRSTESREKQRKTLRDKYSRDVDLDFRSYKERSKFYFAPQYQSTVIGAELLRENGIYNPKHNPNGLVRDHMYSIFDGYHNNIDPIIISHPANCQWIPHKNNCRKREKSCIDINNLKARIALWYPTSDSNRDPTDFESVRTTY